MFYVSGRLSSWIHSCIGVAIPSHNVGLGLHWKLIDVSNTIQKYTYSTSIVITAMKDKIQKVSFRVWTWHLSGVNMSRYHKLPALSCGKMTADAKLGEWNHYFYRYYYEIKVLIKELLNKSFRTDFISRNFKTFYVLYEPLFSIRLLLKAITK